VFDYAPDPQGLGALAGQQSIQLWLLGMRFGKITQARLFS